MHPVIHFQSWLFDVAREPENPINPIRGTSEQRRRQTIDFVAEEQAERERWRPVEQIFRGERRFDRDDANAGSARQGSE